MNVNKNYRIYDPDFKVKEFLNPSNKDEYSQLLDEAMRLMDELEQQIKKFEQRS